MHKLHGLMKFVYLNDRMGLAHIWTICASVVVPRDVPESELQHAANELFRINDQLRARFIEDGENGEVYQEFKPYEERSFEVLRFGSQEELDAWGAQYGGIPLALDVRKMNKKGLSPLYCFNEVRSRAIVKLKPRGMMRILMTPISVAMKRKKLGIKSEPCCCEIKLVKYPGGSGAIVKVHHIVSDAWSMALMANQFLQVLKGEQPVAYSFEEHLENDEAYRASKAFQRDLDYFEEQLKLAEPAVLPCDQTARRKSVTLDKELSASILEYSTTHRMLPYSLFFTAMNVYLRCKKGLNRYFISSLCLNRTGARERNMVGLFYNMPVMLLELDPNASFADTMATINAASFTTMRHQKACYDASNVRPYLYEMSYQNAIIDADPTAICTQYYNNYYNGFMLSAEDRSGEGRFKLHLDVNLDLCPDDAEVDEALEYMIDVLSQGIADDTKPISQLGM